MKRLILTVAFLLMTAGLYAQQAPLSYMYDAANYSANNYYGTARSIALGNAMTAVGGDMGSYGLNPAGSAVATYGQLVVSPGMSMSTVLAGYASDGSMVGGIALTDREKSGRWNLPNAGISCVFKSGKQTGLKALSVAFLVNRTAEYNFSMAAAGTNAKTSLLGEFAATASANRYSHDALNSFDSGVSWDLVSAYRGRLFGGIGGNEYAGNSEMWTEAGYCVPGALDQSVSVVQSGSRSDIILNVGLNISDQLYLGVNCGLPNMERSYMESYRETPVDESLFYLTLPDMKGDPVATCYKGATYSYGHRINMKGAYAKFGVIWVPVRGLRFGAAFQTPTSYNVKERMSYSASSQYANSGCNAGCTSPEDEWGFTMRSPYIVDFGVAVILGQRLLLSADYEMTDYGTMRLNELGSNKGVNDYFANVNNDISKSYGFEHACRFGVEYKVIPCLSTRVGYNFATDPLKDSGSKFRHSSVSCGVGYSSSGSFFIDAAVRWNMYPNTYYMPYFDYDHVDKNGVAHYVGKPSEELSPRVKIDSKLFDVVLTLGWRF